MNKEQSGDDFPLAPRFRVPRGSVLRTRAIRRLTTARVRITEPRGTQDLPVKYRGVSPRVHRSSFAIVFLTLALLGTARPASAQYFGDMFPQANSGNIEGFTVTGKGTVFAKPNRLEIELDISAASELTADAIVKYRDAKKRIEEAFAALKLENVAIEERGLNVGQKGAEMNPYFFDYSPSRKSKVEVELTRALVVKCSDIRKLDEEALLQLVAKLLDVAQDAGGRVGGQSNYNPYYYNRFNNSSSGLVKFILDDFESLEEEAYEKAVTDASARAKRLAKLSKVTLGPVTAIRESASSSQPGAPEDRPGAKKRLESAKFQEIPVKVELTVRFDVAGARGGNGKGGDR